MSKHEEREKWIENAKGKSWSAEALHYDSRIRAGEIGVRIHRTGERTDIEYAVTPETDDAFWMGVFRTENEAVAFCNAMGWPIIEVIK